MSLRARLDPHARRLTDGRLYLAYQLHGEHVVTLNTDWPDLVRYLQSNGYESSPSIGPIPLEAAKRRHDDDRTHDLSLRRVHPDDKQVQYHVHIWRDDDAVDVHSHKEYRPDLRPVGGETWPEAYRRLREHYKPSWGPEWGDGTSYVPGAYDDVVESLTE